MKEIILQNISLIIIAITIITIILAIWFAILYSNLKKFTQGEDGKSLSSTIHKIIDDNDLITSQMEDIINEINTIKSNLTNSIQFARTYKINQANEEPGMQTQITLLLDKNGNGAMITSFHSQSTTRVYTRQIHNYQPDTNISSDELEAIRLAQQELLD